ncbi:MAG: arabinosyltransferase C-terminal domain-containing protein, partial [Pseudonocardiales bacterium]|nr:arabinosyltransferase C-terminal domain-containing protein [Pseudonocardiales bacterium]
SQWARRAPVVLTIAVLLVVAVGSAPHVSTDPARNDPARNDPVRRLLVSGAACSMIALALLTPTPTKFVNHFGAVATAPTVLLAAALLRSPLPRRAGVTAVAAGTVLLVGAMSVSFAGPNLWRPYSDRGQPFGDHLTAAQDHPDLGGMRPSLGPVQLANPALWVAVALAAAGGVWWRRRRGRGSGLTPDRAVLLAGSTAIVVMTLVVFVWAPLRQYPGWSVALSAFRAARGEPCVLADYAQVLLATPAQPVPTGLAVTEGAFTAAADRPAPVSVPVPGTLIWHDAVDDVGGDPDTGPLTIPGGLLVTPWFTLPADGGTTLLVPLIGTRAGRQLTLEYAGPTVAGRSPTVAGSMPLYVDPTIPRTRLERTRVEETRLEETRLEKTQWQQVAIALNRLGPRRPSSVRLVVRDYYVTGADSWLAVGQPRLAGWRPLAALTAGAPVYVDQLTATLLPCVEQVSVEHGIVRAPTVLVLSDEGFGRGFLDLAFELLRGGTLVPVSRSATIVRIPARLVPSGPPALPWGRVERVVYDHPVGLVDLRVDTLQRPGWARLPTLADRRYHGGETG